MDNAIIALLVTIGALENKLSKLGLRLFARRVRVENGAPVVIYSVDVESNRWAEGDRAWRAQALKDLVELQGGRDMTGKSFKGAEANKPGTIYSKHYGRSSVSIECFSNQEQLDVLQSLEVILERA